MIFPLPNPPDALRREIALRNESALSRDPALGSDLRILILAPIGKDAQLISALLDRSRIPNEVCASPLALAQAISSGAGAALIAECALFPQVVADIAEVLRNQPGWSDFPLMLLTVHGEVTEQSQRRRALREPLGNVYLLERPLRPETLLGAVEGALRTRRRQYQVRDQLALYRLAEEALRKSEKLAVTGRLAASIAHEINNPLESVINLLYLMRGAEAQDLPAYLTLAEQELARVTEITKQTLKFYREPLKPAPTDIIEILESVLGLYHSRLTAAEIDVEKDFAPVPSIVAGAGELRQLFANLIGNAIDSMRTGGRLRLVARRARSLKNINDGSNDHSWGVSVTVADVGSGIPQDIVGKVFEPFITTKGDTGTGLGLWVVTEILKKHSGTIRVRSSTKPGQSGTVFTVFLPDSEFQLQAIAQKAIAC